MGNVADCLRSHAAAASGVCIERRLPTDAAIPGFVLGVSEGLCLVHGFVDFRPDGYTVLPLRDICGVRRTALEEHWERMWRAEGLVGGLDSAPAIALGSMEAAVASAQRLFGRMIIECEAFDGEADAFYIGRVARLGEDSLLFDHFDGTGRWERQPARIAYDEITKLQLECPYIRRFWRYVQGAGG